jgi:hypothetical protein
MKGGLMGKLIFLFSALLAGLFCSSPTLASKPMSFYADTSEKERFAVRVIQGGVHDIYADGEITKGTTERFVAFLEEKNIDAAKVHFNSPGGSLLEGMKLGRTIRAMGFFTTVGLYNPKYDPELNSTSICASACAYAYAGGVSRFLDRSSGRLGIHQFYSSAGTSVSEEAVQQISGLIVAYLDEMGIDAKAFTLSTAADRDGMIWLTQDMALLLRFSNNGSSPPVAEIRLLEMNPYLRIQQEHFNVTTRLLFLCNSRTILLQFGIVTEPEQTKLFTTHLKRSYLELDGKEFLVTAGSAGVEGRDSVAWIERSLTPAMLRQLVGATIVDGWIDGTGAVRFGASLEMPSVRGKILDFANQCFAD